MWVSTCLSYPAVLAIQAISFGEYIITGLDSWITVDEKYRFMAYRLVGFSMLWPLMFLNFFSLKKVAGAFQIVATAVKLIVASVIIFTGMYHILFKHDTKNFENSFKGSDWNAGNLVLGVYSGLFAYNGWDVLNFGAEEIENPRRTMPIAAISGITISAIVFILMNVSYFSVLTVEDFKNSPAVAVTFAERTLGDFHYAIPFLISLLLIGSMNTTIFACSRYMYSGANQSVMPTPLRLIHYTSRSPRLAVFAEVLIAICLSFIGNLDQIISYMSFALWSQRTCTQAGFIYFKLTGKIDNKDSFVVPIFVPITFFLICIALLVIPITQNYHVAIYGLSMTAGGALIYLLFIYPKTLPNFLYKINDKLVKFAQLIFNAVIDKFEVLEEYIEEASVLKLKF
ncbi:unnamed protein product [Caenorhabditis sp. 36 PRJEB53466]|nr:unnamed protein product [Caenorhabditis sp. 36 PRJEB53466]